VYISEENKIHLDILTNQVIIENSFWSIFFPC